jgi:serine protease DegS
MPDGPIKRNAYFLAGSVAAGLAIAALIAWLWPQLVRPPAAPALAGSDTSTAQPQQQRPQATGATLAIESVTIPAESAVAVPPTGPAAAESPDPDPTPVIFTFAPAVRASAPAVVNIYAQRTVTERIPGLSLDELMGGPARPRYRERVQRGLGSGVIADRQGHIVTNQHVIAGFDQINVQIADGRTAPAKVVGRDPGTDLAVLQLELPAAELRRLPVMPMGRSDQVEVGDVVLAIGSPLGLTQTVTHGIVSAKGRAQLGVATFEDFIQTDAAINAGNSGGALVNYRGELIGINTAVLGRNLGAEGIGVAIPVDLVRGVMRELLDHGRVIRGWIGIVPEDIAEQYVQPLGLPHAGVVISNLYVNSPALAAGFARGDMIETIDGRTVRSAQDAFAQIASRKPGTTVTIVGMRGSEKFTRRVTVAEAPAPRAANPAPAGTP